MPSQHVATVVEWIKTGEFDEDGDMLAIVDAIRFQGETGAYGFRWKVVLPDITIEEDDLSVLEYEDIERLTRQSWLLLKPARSAREATALLRTVFKHRLGLDDEQINERLKGMKAIDFANAVIEEQVTDPPKDSGT
jgi:hypothetical protein